MKAQIMQIIASHNSLVKAMSNCDIPVPKKMLFYAVELWHRLACEGLDIVELARANGIDAECDMLTGKITVGKDEDE